METEKEEDKVKEEKKDEESMDVDEKEGKDGAKEEKEEKNKKEVGEKEGEQDTKEEKGTVTVKPRKFEYSFFEILANSKSNWDTLDSTLVESV